MRNIFIILSFVSVLQISSAVEKPAIVSPPKPTFPTLSVGPSKLKTTSPSTPTPTPTLKTPTNNDIIQQQLRNISERLTVLEKHSTADITPLNGNHCSLQFVDVTSKTKKSDLFNAGYIKDSDNPLFFCKAKTSIGYGFISQQDAFGVAEEYACRIFINKTSTIVVKEGLKMLQKPPPRVQLQWVKYWPKNAENNFVYTELGSDGVVTERAVKVDRDLYLGRCEYYLTKEKSDVKMPGYIGIGASSLSIWSLASAEEVTRCAQGDEMILSCKVV